MANGNNPFRDWLASGDWGSLTVPTEGLLAEMPQATYYSSPAGGQFAGQSPRPPPGGNFHAPGQRTRVSTSRAIRIPTVIGSGI